MTRLIDSRWSRNRVLFALNASSIYDIFAGGRVFRCLGGILS